MKEIVIDVSHSPRVPDQFITLRDLESDVRPRIIVTLIKRDTYILWINIFTTTGNITNGFECNRSSNLYSSYLGRSIDDVLIHINRMYPNSEFYLIENLTDLRKFLDRIPEFTSQDLGLCPDANNQPWVPS